MTPAKPLDRAISNIKYRLWKYYVRMSLTPLPKARVCRDFSNPPLPRNPYVINKLPLSYCRADWSLLQRKLCLDTMRHSRGILTRIPHCRDRPLVTSLICRSTCICDIRYKQCCVIQEPIFTTVDTRSSSLVSWRYSVYNLIVRDSVIHWSFADLALN